MNINKFLEIEKKYDLCHAEIEGINVWEYCRFEIWNIIICAESLSFNEAHRKSNKIPVFTLIRNFVNSYIKYAISRQRDVDICFITHERRVKKDEYFDCMYSETLIEKYPNSVVLEKPHKYGHLTPIRRDNMYYTDWIVILGNVYAKLQKMFNTRQYRKISEFIKQQWETPFAEIKKEYGLQTNLDKIVKLGAEKYFLCKLQYHMYESIIKKFTPKVIVEVCHYSRQCMLINEIAKKRDIPTIELQHGTMHSEHAAYQYMVEEEIPQLPTELFLFSDFWKSQIRMPIAETKMITTGFPYFEEMLAEYKKTERTDSRKNILFISQGTIGKQLSVLAVELSKRLDASAYKIIYKLHPGEYSGWKSSYVELAESGIEVVDNSEKNIYEYFANADVQIGVYSTAIYEGLGFGLQTMLYDTGFADTMRSLVEHGHAVYVKDADDILEELINEKTVQEGNVFWKSNALKNMRHELENYL